MKSLRRITALFALALVAVPAGAACDEFTLTATSDVHPGGTLTVSASGATAGAYILLWASDQTGPSHAVGPFTLCLGRAAGPVMFGRVGQNGTWSFSLQLPSQLPPQLDGFTINWQGTTLELGTGRPPSPPTLTTHSSNTDDTTIHVP